MTTFSLSQEIYENTLELLGSGIAKSSEQGGCNELYIQPLPKFRRRTPEGRHEATK